MEAITGAAPGTVGEFVVGDQTIAFERTLTTIRLTITNNLTGEVTDIVVPVLNFAQGGGIIGGAPTPSSSQSTMALGALAPTTPLEPRPLVGGRVEGPPAPQPGLGGDLVF